MILLGLRPQDLSIGSHRGNFAWDRRDQSRDLQLMESAVGSRPSPSRMQRQSTRDISFGPSHRMAAATRISSEALSSVALAGRLGENGLSDTKAQYN